MLSDHGCLYGLLDCNLYLEMYKQQDTVQAMQEVFGKAPEELNIEFTDYVRLFRIDPELKKRMEELLNQ